MALILSGDTGVPASGMPTGSVIQTVQGTYNTTTTVSGSTPVTTGLTATITPISATSKILVIANLAGLYNGANNSAGAGIYLYRNGSNVIGNYMAFINYLGAANALIENAGINYLDSPATTSATTYTVYFSRLSASGILSVQANGDLSTIILQEIKA